jgi:hypothetical protein
MGIPFEPVLILSQLLFVTGYQLPLQ